MNNSSIKESRKSPKLHKAVRAFEILNLGNIAKIP
jgi:hypothetical protein